MSGARSLSFAQIDKIGRIRLSEHFFLREFLYSETAIAHGLVNAPDDLELAVEAGSRLCEELLEPLQARFGRIHIRSAFRSCEVNARGNELGLNCASNEENYAGHIWDRKDKGGNVGATACIIIPKLADLLAEPGEWTQIAWWIHDHLPYSSLEFFAQMVAFNIQWRQNPVRRIDSWTGRFEDGAWTQKRLLTKPSMANHSGDHSAAYPEIISAFG